MTAGGDGRRRIRVLDLGWVWAGPLVSSAFADLGADVVKVESRRRLDPYRLRGVERDPRYDDGNRYEASPSFHKLNRGKRSLTINLREPKGRDLILRLAEVADVLIENYSAGTLERLGLGWSELRRRNPRLVAISMSAGGQKGRWSRLRAYALVTTALAGYESLISYAGEAPIGGATFGVADPGMASFGVLAVMAGLWRARRDGRGAYVDLSGIESVIALLGAAFVPGAEDAPALQLCLPCAGDDNWVVAVIDDPEAASQLASELGDAALPDWAAAISDSTQRAALLAQVSAWSLTRSPADVLAGLGRAGIAAAPVWSIEERNAAPQIAGALIDIKHPVTGVERILPSPWGTEGVPAAAPLLGQHVDEVLREWLELSDAEIGELRDQEILS